MGVLAHDHGPVMGLTQRAHVEQLSVQIHAHVDYGTIRAQLSFLPIQGQANHKRIPDPDPAVPNGNPAIQLTRKIRKV